MTVDTAETPTPRPTRPPSSVPFLLPLAAMTVTIAIIGLIVGDVLVLWGGLVGAVLAGTLMWTGLLKSRLDALIVVVAGAIGLWLVWIAIDNRTGPVSMSESLTAAVGWLIVGGGFAFALSRADRTLGLPATLAAAAAWFIAGFVVLQWAEAIGYLEGLRPFEYEAGELQTIDGSFFAWTGSLTVLIGAASGFALHVGTPALAAGSGALAVTMFAANKIAFSVGEFFSQFGRFGELAEQFWPPQWTWPRFTGEEASLHILDPMIETLQIAVVGATIGCAVALPIAFFASRPTTYNPFLYWTSRMVMNVLRTVPDLFWGIIFVTAVGAGSPLAGALAMVMFSMTIMVKLFSETVDTIDPGPLEAAKASGARQGQVIQTAALPQVFPNYVAYALYIFELNIRASVVIGLVGAGGIGLLLNEQRSFFQWDRVMAIVLVIFGAVILIEMLSIYIRKKLV